MYTTDTWCQSQSNNGLFWILFNISSLISLCITIFGVYSITKLCKTTSNPNKITVTTIILIILCTILFTVYIYFCVLTSLNKTIVITLYIIPLILHLVSFLLMRITYLKRIKDRFKNQKKYAISNIVYTQLIILFVMEILSICSVPFIFYDYFYRFQLKYIYIVYVITNILSQLLLLIVLSKIIFKLVKRRKLDYLNSQSIANSNINAIQHDSIETSTTKTATSSSAAKTKKSGNVRTGHILAVLDPIAESTIYTSGTLHSSQSSISIADYKSQKKRNKMLAKSIRNIITTTFAFLFFDMLFLVFSIYNYLFTHTHTHFFIFLWVLHIILITIDEGINIICLHLQHKYSTKFYVKRCNKMHQFVIHLFVKDENNAPIITGTNERVSVPSRTGNTTDGQGL
eukprot:434244_1